MFPLQPSLSYEPHEHEDHEEIYFIISGTGKIKIGNEEARFRDGDIIYIPEKTTHSIANDGEEMVNFLAFGGLTETVNDDNNNNSHKQEET
jgi:mannose-6-phosphate isomerase-like protein (cupin superfamily)